MVNSIEWEESWPCLQYTALQNYTTYQQLAHTVPGRQATKIPSCAKNELTYKILTYKET